MLIIARRLSAVAVEDAEDVGQDVANKAEQRLNSDGDDVLEAVDNEDDAGEDAEANEVVDTGTDLNINLDVNVVGASLGAVRDTVEVALGQTKAAGEVADEGDNTTELSVDVNDVEDVDVEVEVVGVEQLDGILNLLDVQTSQTGNGGLEVSADVGVDINLSKAEQFNLSSDVDGGDKGNSVEAGLAVLVLGVVAADLGGGGSAEGGELDANVDGGVQAQVRLGPAALDDLASALGGLDVEGLARSASARLGPGGVLHVAGALEAIGADVDLGILSDGGLEGLGNGRAGEGQKSSEGNGELHCEVNGGRC